ncbi:MAG: ROK family protein [Lachnospiraceae bacterium]|nr:ROK family protein [Lachnospiraceae bacterium]
MVKINNTGIVRQLNLDIVRDTLREEDGLTKSMLARKTGMSIATCGNLLHVLIEKGEVIEGEIDNLTGGRPAKTYYYNGENEMILCIYILVEENVTIHIELYDNVGRLQEEYEKKYDRITEDDIYEQIDAAIGNYEKIKMISIGIPGYVLNGTIDSCDEPNLNNKNIEKTIKEKYKTEVLIGAEKLFTVYGYYKRNDMDDESTLVYMLVPKGKAMGAGIMIDGRILRGGNELAGETMYLPYYYIKEQGVAIEEIVNEMPFIINTMVAVIAPQKFIISGSQFSHDSCEEIRRECSKLIPEKFIPEIVYEENTLLDYKTGLVNATLEKFNSGIKVVETGRL